MVLAINDQIYHVFLCLQTWHPILKPNHQSINDQPLPFYQRPFSFFPKISMICDKHFPSFATLESID